MSGLEVKIKYLYDLDKDSEFKTLTLETEGSAAFDLCSRLDIEVGNLPTLIPTGISLEMPVGVFAIIAPRSSTALKRGLIMSNSFGLIDSDYRGELHMMFHALPTISKPIGNHSRLLASDVFPSKVQVNKGDRLGQLLFLRQERVNLIPVSSLSDTARGNGGFGSTGL